MIDIDKLTEAELMTLNRRIVERLRFMQQMRSHQKMMEFSLGERVTFQSSDGEQVVGTLSKYNKKTVSIVTDCGCKWNVSPGLVSAYREDVIDVTPQ